MVLDGVGFLAVFFFCSIAAAQIPDINIPIPTNAIRNATQTMDRYHADISERVNISALRLDEWLGGESELEEEEEQDAVLRVRLSLKVSRDQGMKVNPSMSGHASLPRLKKRVHLFADNLRRGALPGEEDERTQDDEFRAGIRLHLYKQLRSLLSWDAGLRFGPFPQPFTTLTASYKRPVGRWTFQLIEQGYWQAGDGFGEVTEMDWDYPLRTNLLFRSITAATWGETTKGVEFEQTVRTTWIIEKGRRSLQTGASVFAHKIGVFEMTNYRIYTSYTRRLHRPWLFGEISPQIDFPKEEDFGFTPSIRIAVSAYFGKNP